MINDISDVCFRDEEDVTGNFSKTLNFLLDLMRLRSKWREDIELFGYRAKYLRGDRSEEVMKGLRKAELIMIKYLLEHDELDF
jgi:hypothetical protein